MNDDELLLSSRADEHWTDELGTPTYVNHTN